MANPGFLELEGNQQGVIESSIVRSGKEDMIQFFTFDHQLHLQADQRGGYTAAERRHEPIVISKEIDKATPSLYKALCTGEKIKSAKFRWFATLGSRNEEQQIYSITITDAKIIGIETIMPDTRETAEGHINLSERVMFAYENIIWSYGEDEAASYEDESHPDKK